MAETVGVLKVRFDAEAGAALELLAELERDVNEARQLAKEFFQRLQECDESMDAPHRLVKLFPWLEDKE